MGVFCVASRQERSCDYFLVILSKGKGISGSLLLSRGPSVKNSKLIFVEGNSALSSLLPKLVVIAFLKAEHIAVFCVAGK